MSNTVLAVVVRTTSRQSKITRSTVVRADGMDLADSIDRRHHANVLRINHTSVSCSWVCLESCPVPCCVRQVHKASLRLSGPIVYYVTRGKEPFQMHSTPDFRSLAPFVVFFIRPHRATLHWPISKNHREGVTVHLVSR